MQTMTASPSTIFLSHGSPMLALEDVPARRFLQTWSVRRPLPRAILVVSPHWECRGGPDVSFATAPMTLHDFGGFPKVLYELHYPAPGAAEFAAQAHRLLERANFKVKSSYRGLDHGAWIPLSLMYPKADLPVFQVSQIRGGGPQEHYRLGQALGALREQGVLIVGSGSLTHNLREFAGRREDAPAPLWVRGFADWVAETLAGGRIDDLLDYRARGPFAARNHPTEEHLMPLFVALGAAGNAARAERVHTSTSYGVLSMDAYTFSPADAATNPATAEPASPNLYL